MTDTSLITRRAAVDDIGAVAELQFRSHTISFADFARPEWVESRTLPPYMERWTEYVRAERDDLYLIVACQGDEIVGMVSIDGPSGQGAYGDCAHLNGMHVDPGRRGGGIGRLLMAAALEHIRERSYAVTILGCLASNTYARRFYELSEWKPIRFFHEEPYGWTYLHRYLLR
jgi:ribosomal protein S18 acetylase RimI-like enzyme